MLQPLLFLEDISNRRYCHNMLVKGNKERKFDFQLEKWRGYYLETATIKLAATSSYGHYTNKKNKIYY